jgi:hypothetical protein
VDTFSPYTEVKDENPEARRAAKALIRRKMMKSSYIFVNNRLEGNALQTIARMLDEAFIEGGSTVER